MTTPKRNLFACGTDNDGFPECQGDGSACGPGGRRCAELTTPNRAQLRERLSEILDAFPEHNTTAEHDTLLDQVMGALGEILEGIEEVTTPK